MTHRIFAIVITYNGKQWYDECFTSLLNSSVHLDIIAVDNASQDDSVKYIKENFPDIDIIPLNENLGFGKANNIGIRHAIDQGGNYFFLLNQDARIETHTVETLLHIHQTYPQYGVLSPLHMNHDGSSFDGGFENYAGPEYTKDLLSDLYLQKVKHVYDTRFVNAAAWLLSKQCLEKVGGFDPIFFHYGEDYNYCQRIQFHGFKVGIVPGARIYHNRTYRPEAYGKEQILRHYLISMTDIGNEDFNKTGIRLRRQDYARMASGLMKGDLNKLRENWNNLIIKRKYNPKIHKSRELNRKGGMIYL